MNRFGLGPFVILEIKMVELAEAKSKLKDEIAALRREKARLEATLHNKEVVLEAYRMMAEQHEMKSEGSNYE